MPSRHPLLSSFPPFRLPPHRTDRFSDIYLSSRLSAPLSFRLREVPFPLVFARDLFSVWFFGPLSSGPGLESFPSPPPALVPSPPPPKPPKPTHPLSS